MNSLVKIYIPIAGLIAAGALLQSCGNGKSEKEGKTDTTAVVANSISAVRLDEGKLSTTITIPGELDAFQNVDIYAKVSSFVKKLYVDVGSEVKQGQLLAVTEAPELNAQMDAATARVQSQKAIYVSDKATYDRLLETSKVPGTVSPNDLEVADAKQRSDYSQYQAALSAVKEIQDTRNYLEIRAPFSGIITARNVSEGAFVSTAGAGSALPVFNLQQQKLLRLIIEVPSTSAGNLKLGSIVTFTVKSLPGQTFKATISRLAGALDSKLRSQHIEANVENDNKILLPGMVTEVEMPLSNSSTSYVIPATALLNSTMGIFVIKAENNKSVWIPVTTGANTGDSVEVYGNLNKNDTLINNVSEEIRDSATLTGALKIR